MKRRKRQTPRRFQLQIMSYGNGYYIERVSQLETALARRPRTLQLDLVGVGEIPADAALRIRALLVARQARTRIVTNALSSLQNGSVLVWLLGAQRLIREDAKLYFRRADLPEEDVAQSGEDWKEEETEFCDSYSGIDPEEGDHARVLELINEYLPVKELTGRLFGMPVLRQFGLVENEEVDDFLATALGNGAKATGLQPGKRTANNRRSAAKSTSSRRAG